MTKILYPDESYAIMGACFNVYKKSLAIAGKSGTLSNHLTSKNLQGKIFAKTGTLDGTKALSGYIDLKSNIYAFSFINNNIKNCRNTWETLSDACNELIKGM